MFSKCVSAALAVFILLLPTHAQANDAAAETAAGGIRLREEHRVAMTKERLTISKVAAAHPESGGFGDRYHVTVEYEFLAEPGPDVRTEVAFPLPEYSYGFVDLAGTRRIGNFTVEVDGQRIRTEKQVRAYVEGRDVTRDLAEAGIDIETFGGFTGDAKAPNYAVARLPAERRDALVAKGLLNPAIAGEPFGLGPTWSVVATYFWRQVFPAGKIVKVRHEYDAIAGLAYVSSPEQLARAASEPAGCFDGPLLKALASAQQRARGATAELPLIYFHWVSYILTTANTWRTPISDFELNIDFPEEDFVSLCWDGPVERVSKSRFRARKKDFVPSEELTVYFLTVGQPKPMLKWPPE